MRRDTIFYQLFQQLPTLLFEFIPQPPENAQEYSFDAIEVKETGFRLDGVFTPPNPAGTVYFCEVQFQLDELLYERMKSRCRRRRVPRRFPQRAFHQAAAILIMEFQLLLIGRSSSKP